MVTIKTRVIERLFQRKWNPATRTLSDPKVTLEDVRSAIEEVNLQVTKNPLSPRNPANFFKDFRRRRTSANANWPKSVFDRGYTARQTTGRGYCFEFVAATPGQTEPFPSESAVPVPDETTPTHKVSSVVLPSASRKLGRKDEPWLVQVAVRLRLIETHLSIFSPLAGRIVSVDHLQNSVKLRQSEIDAVFLAEESGTDSNQIIITCEAKSSREDLTFDQLRKQPLEAMRATGIGRAIPFALQVVGPSRVYVVEFDEIAPDFSEEEDLVVASAAIYELRPAVPGIR